MYKIDDICHIDITSNIISDYLENDQKLYFLNNLGLRKDTLNSLTLNDDDEINTFLSLKDGKFPKLKDGMILTINNIYYLDTLNKLKNYKNIFNIKHCYLNKQRGYIGFFKNHKVDLSPLKGINIQEIDLSNNVYDDLTPLKGMPIQDIDLEHFEGDLAPLEGMSIQKIKLNHFKGDLTPLKGMPIREIHLHSFQGDLTPLHGMPIQKIYLNSFQGDLTPLTGMPIESIELDMFQDDLTPLEGMPIRNIKLNGFNDDLTPLNGMYIESIDLTSYEGDLTPLEGMPIREIILDNFQGDLTPLKGMPIVFISLDNFQGDLTPLKDVPKEHIYLNKDYVPIKHKIIISLAKIDLPNGKNIKFEKNTKYVYDSEKRAFYGKYENNELVPTLTDIEKDDCRSRGWKILNH